MDDRNIVYAGLTCVLVLAVLARAKRLPPSEHRKVWLPLLKAGVAMSIMLLMAHAVDAGRAGRAGTPLRGIWVAVTFLLMGTGAAYYWRALQMASDPPAPLDLDTNRGDGSGPSRASDPAGTPPSA